MDRHRLHLTDSDIGFFAENGYLIYRHQLLPAEKFHRLQRFFDGMLAQLPADARPEGMDTPHFAFPELFEWLGADEVLDFVERLIGPNIALWASHFLCKLPRQGLAVPWHEDSAYWNKTLSEHKVVTVWLAIDDSLPDNGCMRVIPGTHHHGFSEYEEVDASRHVFGTQIRADQLDESKAVDLAIRAGECHVHHAKLMHRSSPQHQRPPPLRLHHALHAHRREIRPHAAARPARHLPDARQGSRRQRLRRAGAHVRTRQAALDGPLSGASRPAGGPAGQRCASSASC